MNQLYVTICKLLCVAFFLTACGRETTTFVPAGEENAGGKLDAVEQADVAETRSEVAEGSATEADTTEVTPSGQVQASETKPVICYVHVSGAVYKPGVYQLPGDSRVYEAIARAGGLREDAYEGAVNQAELVTDGQMIVIPTYDEWNASGGVNAAGQETAADDGLVNINTADETTLCSLPGIGLSRAQAIIAYRQEHGEFASLEAIQNVTGIKAGLYEKIKDKIKLSN